MDKEPKTIALANAVEHEPWSSEILLRRKSNALRTDLVALGMSDKEDVKKLHPHEMNNSELVSKLMGKLKFKRIFKDFSMKSSKYFRDFFIFSFF